jgi:hypothetical protein
MVDKAADNLPILRSTIVVPLHLRCTAASREAIGRLVVGAYNRKQRSRDSTGCIGGGHGNQTFIKR